MTLGKKLLLSSGAASAVTLVVSLVAWINVSNLGQAANKLANVNARKLYLAGEMNAAISDMVAEERGILNGAYVKDKASIDKFNQDFEQNSARLKKHTNEIAPLIETVAGRQCIADVQNAYNPILQAHGELLQLALAGNTEAASNLLTEKVMPIVTKVSDTANQLSQQQDDLMATATKAAESS